MDAISEAVIPGLTVRIDGVGEATSGPDGAFAIEVPDVQMVRTVTLISPATVQRTTQLRIPGPDAALSVIRGEFDLSAFDQMFRYTGQLQRWISPPRIVLQRRVLQFTAASDNEFMATVELMSDTQASDLLTNLAWALPQVTGGRFSAFAGEQQETASAGERVIVARSGDVVVAHYEGLEAATGFWGWGRWATDGRGAVRGGIVMLDRRFENSGSQFRRSLSVHELGHALGYGHVTSRTSFMNASARIEPNAFDRDASKVGFQREPEIGHPIRIQIELRRTRASQRALRGQEDCRD